MELWQMDIVGGVPVVDPETGQVREAKIVSGIDDHSRFVVCARVVARATARPVCDALEWALGRYGCPDQILTDNGKVFTNRFGLGSGRVLFDRICTNNSISHILTKPRSPTTTGKVERFHKTLRAEFLNGKVFDLDRGGPGRSGRLGRGVQPPPAPSGHRQGAAVRALPAGPGPARARGDARGGHGHRSGSGDHPAGQQRRDDQFRHRPLQGWRAVAGWPDRRGGLRRRSSADLPPRRPGRHARPAPPRRQADRRHGPGRTLRPSRPTATAASVTRKVDSSGHVCFAGTAYRVGNNYRRRQVQVAVVGDTVEISLGKELIRSHKVRHDRTRNTGPGQPRRPTPPHQCCLRGLTCRACTGVEVSGGYRVLTSRGVVCVRARFMMDTVAPARW